MNPSLEVRMPRDSGSLRGLATMVKVGSSVVLSLFEIRYLKSVIQKKMRAWRCGLSEQGSIIRSVATEKAAKDCERVPN
jgi:hypothetical protein